MNENDALLLKELRKVITLRCDPRSDIPNDVLRLTEALERATRERAQFLELLKRWLGDDPQGTLFFDTEDVLRWAGVDLTEVEVHA